MSGSAPHRSYPAILELRKAGGRWLRKLRERRGLSQSDLARLIGAEYHTYISQLETGRGRIPPNGYRIWAEALDINPQDFVRQLLSFYDPVTYDILFGTDNAASRGQPHEACALASATPSE